MTFSTYAFTNRAMFEGRTTQRTNPARHIACPQRLKYIHNINDSLIPYVEDSNPIFPGSEINGPMSKSPAFGLYNATDAWQNELRTLAQQVQNSMKTVDETIHNRSLREDEIRRTSSVHPSDEQLVTKRLPKRSSYSGRLLPSLSARSEISGDQSTVDASLSDTGNQDHGIWLLPILCHTLHINTIPEAQEWLTNANPTEKRLAMELISRKMQDMHPHGNEFHNEMTNSTTSFEAPNFNNFYLPYKFWQRPKQSQITPRPPSMAEINSQRCERATSPLRLVTPVRRSSATPTTAFNSSERPLSRDVNSPLISSALLRTTLRARKSKPDVLRMPSPPATQISTPGSDRITRRSFRVATSTSRTNDEVNRDGTDFWRGKTPLV